MIYAHVCNGGIMTSARLILLWILIAAAVAAGTSRIIEPVDSVREFDDVRWKDLSGIDVTELRKCFDTLTFNKDTVWPEEIKPAVEELMKQAMSPPLGISKLHEEGITGQGVNVAIIDQPLLQDHPEFKGKIAAYYDTGCDGQLTSMHGPAVVSLLVGEKCGTAPGAKVYYAAAPSWKGDASYYAKALDWILEINATLPRNEKIRVVSVSASPSGEGSPFTSKTKMWDEACERAKEAGIVVLDCTRHIGFIGPCYYDLKTPDDLRRCRPGFPGIESTGSIDLLCAPCSPRTSAEQNEPNDFSYQYNGRGGLSWSIPYTAGVLALGWQIKPDYSPQQMRELLVASAYPCPSGGQIINPRRFIQFVKNPLRAEKELNKIKSNTGGISQDPVGVWKSVDFVSRIEDFIPGQKLWAGRFHLMSVVFRKDGTTSIFVKWRNGKIIDESGKTKADFVIKKMSGRTYMFFPWLSDDVTIHGMDPKYYVLQKVEETDGK
jgi:serine protease AprX